LSIFSIKLCLSSETDSQNSTPLPACPRECFNTILPEAQFKKTSASSAFVLSILSVAQLLPAKSLNFFKKAILSESTDFYFLGLIINWYSYNSTQNMYSFHKLISKL